ncbi:hypothetical protein CKAH01_16526 [Colletotrichum kahawae]|uniref:Uncharacterized protein n=1 Tax=Colletotrichum kahawae TaxID=34407 RepID=A0AAD9YF25_COLKA|nr:hypothetical protein CKAH01_16526 [Colletotrichum kahawae]
MKTCKRCAMKNRREQGWARWSTVQVPSLPVTVGFVESGSQGLQFRLRQSTTMPVLSCACVCDCARRTGGTSACLLQVGGVRGGRGGEGFVVGEAKGGDGPLRRFTFFSLGSRPDRR